MKRTYQIGGALLVLSLAAVFAIPAHAVPGDALRVVTVPVPSPTGLGVSVAADCEGNLYYTNYQSPYLHKITALGALISTVSLADAAGGPLTLGEMAWDDKRKVLWAGTDSQSPIKIYQVDPVTGICTYKFDGGPGISLTDGLAYEDAADGDPANDMIYHSPDVSCDVYVFQAISGALVRTITPLNAAGSAMCGLSGLTVGIGSQLYVGHNGFGEIFRVDKFTGAFLGGFSTPGGRDEGLECDAMNFLPKLALWSKDAYNDQITAIEVEPRTCNCGGVVPTVPSTWGSMKARYR
jgi:hypothetical protein